ncbi:MAG: hypothetical protein P9L99_04700 [Candidatus Lernaella stagnicola]|nr:hypothetical protein [Candidatus Lernaella stagnicola]
MRKYALTAGLILTLALAACVTEFDSDGGLSSFAIRIADGEIGSPGSPQAFPDEPLRYVLQIRALDENGDFLSTYAGKLAFRVEPVGHFAAGQQSRVEIENGTADAVELYVEACHGDVTIWVEDAGGLDQSGTYAAGATPMLYFEDPTLTQVQRTDNFESSGLFGDFVEVRVADRNVVVTNVRRDGFYCQDLDEPGGSWAGMFVYTHNRPEVETGMRLTALRGQVDEYFGFTELGFPDYLAEPTDETVDPFTITPSLMANDIAMEELESSLVQVEDITVCPVDETFYAYDQWRVSFSGLSGCGEESNTILVAETAVFDEIDPPSMEGKTFVRVTGNLRYHYLANPGWMVIPRRAGDFE